MDLDCREAMYGGAAGGGKSQALLLAALKYVDEPGYSALIIRRTTKDLGRANALLDRARSWLQSTEAIYSKENMRWTFPSGATLEFGYLASEKDRQQYQSAEYHFIGIDELTQFLESDYRWMFSRIRRTDATSHIPLRMRSASNPGGIGHDWVRQRFVKSVETPDRVFIPATIHDNPGLDVEKYIEGMQELPDSERERLLNGDWEAGDDGLLSYDSITACEVETSRCLWLSGISESRRSTSLYIGFDVGRTADKSVIWTWELTWVGASPLAICRDIHVMEDVTYGEQWERLYLRMSQPGVVATRIDQGGIGADIAERAEILGVGNPLGVSLGETMQGKLGLRMAKAFETGLVQIPRDEALRADLRMVRKIDLSGRVAKLSTNRDKSGHGDRFWAGALGLDPLMDDLAAGSHAIVSIPRYRPPGGGGSLRSPSNVRRTRYRR